jgi:hypothetical protein
VTHSIISRAQFIVAICGVFATLALVGSHLQVGSEHPGACSDVSTGGALPVGYRMP